MFLFFLPHICRDNMARKSPITKSRIAQAYGWSAGTLAQRLREVEHKLKPLGYRRRCQELTLWQYQAFVEAWGPPVNPLEEDVNV